VLVLVLVLVLVDLDLLMEGDVMVLVVKVLVKGEIVDVGVEWSIEMNGLKVIGAIEGVESTSKETRCKDTMFGKS